MVSGTIYDKGRKSEWLELRGVTENDESGLYFRNMRKSLERGKCFGIGSDFAMNRVGMK